MIENHNKKDTQEKQESTKEEQKAGSVGGHVYRAYLKSVDSLVVTIIVAICLIIEQTITSLIDLFVSKW